MHFRKVHTASKNTLKMVKVCQSIEIELLRLTDQHETEGASAQHALVAMLFDFLNSVDNDVKKLEITEMPSSPYFTLAIPEGSKNGGEIAELFY